MLQGDLAIDREALDQRRCIGSTEERNVPAGLARCECCRYSGQMIGRHGKTEDIDAQKMEMRTENNLYTSAVTFSERFGRERLGRYS